MWFNTRGRALRCQTIPTQIIPTSHIDIPFKSLHQSPFQLSLFRRSIRGVLRWTSLCIRFSPSLILSPLCWVSHWGTDIWWRYTLWAIESSGPTAIKFVQWAGTRRDLLDPEVIEKLSRVHAQVRAIPFSKMQRVLQQSLGDDWETQIHFSEAPELLGSGSIAQVYAGKLPQTGEKVAVKIVRPDTRELIAVDVDLMRFGAHILESLPFTKFRALGVSEAVGQFAEFIHAQVDLTVEAANIKMFQRNFHSSKTIKFPDVHFATPDVLVESFVNGQDLNHFLSTGIKDERKHSILQKGLTTFMKMLFTDNFVHADLHPGNILYDSAKDELCLIDCGLVSQLTPRDFANFTDLFYAIVTGNSKSVGDMIIERSRAPKGSVIEPEKFAASIESLINSVHAQKHGFSLRGVDLGNLFTQLMALAYTHGVKLETNFVSTLCSLIVLEGVGKELDPELDVLKAAKPYLFQTIKRRAQNIAA